MSTQLYELYQLYQLYEPYEPYELYSCLLRSLLVLDLLDQAHERQRHFVKRVNDAYLECSRWARGGTPRVAPRTPPAPRVMVDRVAAGAGIFR